MQVDFTTISRHQRKIKDFVTTLGFNRATYVQFSEHERQKDWLQNIAEACHYFGGVPQEILFNNAKTHMIEREAYGEGRHCWNARLLATAQNYGFIAHACRPYRARTRGKVERFNGYLKVNFITPLAVTLNQAELRLPRIYSRPGGSRARSVNYRQVNRSPASKSQAFRKRQ